MNTLATMSQTMSSIEIAELTSKEHKNVLRDIRDMLSKLDGSNLSHEQYQELKDERGYVKEILLDKELSTTLVSGYSVPMRHKIIKRWQELEQTTQTIAAQNNMTQKELIQQAKLDAQLVKARLMLQRALDATEQQKLNHETKMAQLKDKRTRILSQGSKLKANGTISKLALPVDTITNLLKLHGSMLKPSDANNMLKRLGYLSDDGSEVTDAGSFYGRTIRNSESSHTSLPRWFKEEFGVLLNAIMQEWDIVNE